jgi:hypothetical protein
MVGIMQLWLPILLSAVLVFFASSVIHMMTKWHAGDFAILPNEDKTMDALRPLNIPPGEYMMPRAGSMEAMKSPEFQAKFAKGPVAILNMMPGGTMDMKKPLTNWFLFSVVVSLFAAYLAGRALPPGSAYLTVFRFAGTTAFIGYTLGNWPQSIWYARPWSTTMRSTLDGLLYGLLTGGAFGWLWPK